MGLTSVLSNVVSRESDVRSVLAKVALGEADAGFVYSTDAKTVPGKVNVIKIPAWAQPKVTYSMAVVSSSTHKTAAKKYIAEVLSKAGQKKLLAAGFLPLPEEIDVRRALLAVAYFSRRRDHAGVPDAAGARDFFRVPPGELIDQLSNPVVTDALIVSFKTTLIAQALVLLFGTPTAYLLASRRFPGRQLCITFVELPLVLPPAVAGIALLATFGRVGLLGSTLETFGITIPFTQTAVTLAVAFVASPLYIRQAIAAFEAIDPNLVAASRTLGAGPVRTFFRVVLPLASGGLIAGEALAFARGLGEFGATIMFAGSLQKVTQTLPLAIYAEFEVDFDVTLAISALLVLISAALLIALKLVSQWQSSEQTSPSLFGRLSWS